VTCAASLKGPKARAKGGPAQGPACRSVRRSLSETLLKRFKYTKASNSRKTPIGQVLKRCPPPRPESYRAGRGRPHSESFISRWGRVILFGSHTVCPLQLKSLRAHQTSTSPRTRSHPLGARRAGAKGGASNLSLAPPPTPGGKTAPEQRQDPWDPPPELNPQPFLVLATQKRLLKLLESRKARQERSTPYPQPRTRSLRENSETPARRTFRHCAFRPFPGLQAAPPLPRPAPPTRRSADPRPLQLIKRIPTSSPMVCGLGKPEVETLREGWTSVQHPRTKNNRRTGRIWKTSLRNWRKRSCH
jgi:hypothetical protein